MHKYVILWRKTEKNKNALLDVNLCTDTKKTRVKMRLDYMLKLCYFL